MFKTFRPRKFFEKHFSQLCVYIKITFKTIQSFLKRLEIVIIYLKDRRKQDTHDTKTNTLS